MANLYHYVIIMNIFPIMKLITPMLFKKMVKFAKGNETENSLFSTTNRFLFSKYTIHNFYSQTYYQKEFSESYTNY